MAYKLLQSKFPKELDTSLSKGERNLFDKLGTEVALPTHNLLTLSNDLQEVTQARRRFDALPDRDFILQERQASTILLKNDKSGGAGKAKGRRAKTLERPMENPEAGLDDGEDGHQMDLEEDEDVAMEPATVGKYFSQTSGGSVGRDNPLAKFMF